MPSCLGGVMSLGQVLFRQHLQALLAEQAEVDGGGQGGQRLVRANVGGGFLAPDVLLARGQGQDEPAPALGIVRLPDEPAGHLAQEFLLRREEAEVGSAESQRNAKGLRLATDDVGRARWLAPARAKAARRWSRSAVRRGDE